MIIAILLLLPLIGAAITAPVARRGEASRDRMYHIETAFVFLCAACAFVLQLRGRTQALFVPGICGFGLSLKLDGFRSLYTLIASFMWLMTGLLSKEYFAHYRNKTRYYWFNQFTLMGTLGIFMSDDLYTTFIFFEIMSLSSYPWVAHDENAGAMSAGKTYLAIAVFGGMVTLMGLFMTYARIGSLSFEALELARGRDDMVLPAALILVGFAAKAGLFPLYIWLPQAHPVAPAPASALLSGVLTKTGVFGMLIVSWKLMLGHHAYGNVMLALGLITMLLGAVLALLSTNLKRILACSSMSQIGYITVGIAMAVLLGEEGHVPASGAIMHMVNHSLLKLTLFMAAGVLYMNLHKLELNDIRGFGIGKPLLKAAFLLGGVGLAGVPLFNGYLGKTLIHEGILEFAEEVGHFTIYNVCEWIFLFAAGITTAYMLKIYIALFHMRHPKDQAKFTKLNGRYMNRRSAFALCASMLLIPLLGCFPAILEAVSRLCTGFTGIEGVHGIHYFSIANLKGGAISLLIGTTVYLTVVRKCLYSPKKGFIPVNIGIGIAGTPIAKGFMALVDLLCNVVDHAVENRFVFGLGRWVSGTLFPALDNIVDNGFVLKTVPDAFTALTRALAGFIDGIVLFFTKTLFRHMESENAMERKQNRLNDFACAVFDSFSALRSFLSGKGFVNRTDHTRQVASLLHEGEVEFSRVTHSVSFALILFVGGLLVTLIYLILL